MQAGGQQQQQGGVKQDNAGTNSSNMAAKAAAQPDANPAQDNNLYAANGMAGQGQAFANATFISKQAVQSRE